MASSSLRSMVGQGGERQPLTVEQVNTPHRITSIHGTPAGRQTMYGGTIAHGYFTRSCAIVADEGDYEGWRSSIAEVLRRINRAGAGQSARGSTVTQEQVNTFADLTSDHQ